MQLQKEYVHYRAAVGLSLQWSAEERKCLSVYRISRISRRKSCRVHSTDQIMNQLQKLKKYY